MPVLNQPVAIFLTIMAVVLITPLLSERIRLPGIVGIILGGMLVGPHGLKLLAEGGQIGFLADIGLIYLMFSAGLEVDLQQFNRVRGRSLIFGLFTFLTPQLMGMALGRVLGMSWLGSVLLGSAFSSHTLIAFPILSRLRIIRNEAIAVTVGATVFTDISAFIVLAAVLAIDKGQLEAAYFIRLAIFLAIYAVAILYGLPRLGKLFFRRFSGRAVEFQFVLLVLFISAVLAEAIGVHAVVGAFLAGLAINATLPRHSPVNNYVLFLGESFFIPVFLLYSGMITDPTAFWVDSRTLLIGAAVTFVAYVSKFFAAWLAARLFKYTRDEFWTVWGLSHAQAAVTIPTLVIGLEIGLFSNSLFNAAILMILFTSITSPLVVQRFGPRLKVRREEASQSGIFKRVLLPVANPETQRNLLSLGSLLAHMDEGELLVAHIIASRALTPAEVDQQREILERTAQILDDPAAKLTILPRVEESVPGGILHIAIEQQASAILLGWRGSTLLRDNLMGTTLDEVIVRAGIPVLIARLNSEPNSYQRVVLLFAGGNLTAGHLRPGANLAFSLSQELNVPLAALTHEKQTAHLATHLRQLLPAQEVDVLGAGNRFYESVGMQLNSQDLVILLAASEDHGLRTLLGHQPEKLAAATNASIVVVHWPA